MEVQNLKVCDITPSAMNPRKTFDKDSLAELAENIKNQGLLQPITVRPVPEEASVKINKDGSTSEFKYEIVCGERRFRACKMNGMEYILGIVREMSDEEAFFAMVTENLQRKDVDPLEEASAINELLKYGQSPADIAIRLGRSERFVNERIRLLNLIEPLREQVRDGFIPISAGMLLSKLDKEVQQEFFDDNFEDGDSGDDDHWTYVEVKDWVDNHFGYLRNVAFLDEKGDEPWHDGKEFPKCKTCLNNTANHGCLFYEMKGDAKCTKLDCRDRKAEAFTWHFIHTHDFLKANEAWKPGKMVFYADEQRWWNDKHKEEFRKRLEPVQKEGYETWTFSKFDHLCYYDADDERRKEMLKNGEAVEVLDINNSFNTSVRCFVMKKSDSVMNVKNLLNRIDVVENDRTWLDDQTKEKLQDFVPQGFGGLEKDIMYAEMLKRDDALVKKLVRKDSWSCTLDECFTYVRKHPAAKMDIEQSFFRNLFKRGDVAELRRKVLDETQPGTFDKIFDEFLKMRNAKVSLLVEKLRNLGYDKDGNPIEKEAQ